MLLYCERARVGRECKNPSEHLRTSCKYGTKQGTEHQPTTQQVNSLLLSLEYSISKLRHNFPFCMHFGVLGLPCGYKVSLCPWLAILDKKPESPGSHHKLQGLTWRQWRHRLLPYNSSNDFELTMSCCSNNHIFNYKYRIQGPSKRLVLGCANSVFLGKRHHATLDVSFGGTCSTAFLFFLPAAKPSRSRRGESPPPPGEKSRKTQDRAKLIQCKVVQYENYNFLRSQLIVYFQLFVYFSYKVGQTYREDLTDTMQNTLDWKISILCEISCFH